MGGERLEHGRWSAEWVDDLVRGPAVSVEGDDHDGDEDMGLYVMFRSRQDVSDLIALLERVRERLP